MSLNIKGYVQALGLSGKHLLFTDVHRTYSPSPVLYNAGSTYSDFELVVLHQLAFSELNDDPIESSLLDQLYTVIQWLLDESIDGALTADTTANNTTVGIVFNTETVTVTLGPATDDSASRTLPEWVNVVIGDNTFKFWLLDTALETQYNTRQYRIANPITDKDNFYTSSKSGLLSLMASYLNSPYTALSAATASSPTTRVIDHTEQWVEQANTSNTVDVRFLLAVYGPGNAPSEEIREALRDYLLDGSAYESGAWESVFPGIFKVSSFSIIPAFDDIVVGSIPQYYNSIVDVNDYYSKLEDAAFNYTANWVNDNTQMLPTVYQSLLCMVIPDESNDLAKRDFQQFFPDYILASSLDPDYIRMSTNTRKLVDYLMETLPLTEGTTTVIPTGVTEELINGLRWYRFTVGEAQIKILTKASLDTII